MTVSIEMEHKVAHDDERAHTLESTGPTSSAYDLAKAGNAAAKDHHAQVKSVFEQMDDAKIGWFHVKTVIIAGMGFFCDSYDLFSISLVTKTIGRIYYPDVSYNCMPCASLDPIDPTSSTCLTAAGSGKNCVQLLQYFNIVNSLSQFNPGFDPTGAGWASQEDNTYFGTGIPDGNQSIWNKLLSHRQSAIPADINNTLLAVALCGTLCGQLFFGYLGDRLGRRRVFAFTLYLMIIACAAQAFSFGSSATSVLTTLFVFRFILGLGVGGDYPLSATLMSEYSSKRNRGALVGAVFAMQGTGYLAAATVAIIFSSIWDASPNANPDHLWRIILAFGAIPTALTLYARLNMPETPRYTMFVEQNATQLVDDMNYVLAQERARTTGENVALPASLRKDVPIHEKQQQVKLNVKKRSYSEFFNKYWKTLLGTSLCWFFLDIAFYSQSLTQSTVFSAVGWLPSAYTMSITQEAYRIARAQAIVALASVVPGYWCTVFTVEYLGRWKIQLGGFLMMTLFMGILAGDYDNLVNNHASSFVGLYCMTFFFANWGPNSTTFIIPSEVFPTQYRSLGHGISAAAGKAGAIIGTFGFLYMQQDVSTAAALSLLTAVNGIGFFCTFLVPETKGKSLEELTDDKIVPEKQGKLLDDLTEDGGRPTVVISKM